MADSFIPYQDPTTVNRKLDSESLAVGANTVERERVQVSGASALEIAAVINSAPSAEYALVTRNIPSGTQVVSAAALPLPSGAATLAEQQTQTASLGVIDDWDESDRAKVNPIVGQAGIDGGSGTISSKTTRTVQASDATDSVGGNAAHDAVDSGNPVKVGQKAIAFGANPTAVAAADRTDWYANRAGVPFVLGGHMNVVTLEAAYTGAQTDAAVVTVAGGLKIVVTECEAICANSNTVDTSIRVGFGTANTPTTTGVVLTHPGIAAGSGVVRGNGSGILGVGADGEDLRVTCSVPTGGSVRVLVSYFTIES